MNLNILGSDFDFRLWVIIILSAIISVVMLSRHGEALISVYYRNKRNEGMYDEKKLSRVIGIAMAVMVIILLAFGFLGTVIPDSYSSVFVLLVFLDLFAAIFIALTKCRK